VAITTPGDTNPSDATGWINKENNGLLT